MHWPEGLQGRQWAVQHAHKIPANLAVACAVSMLDWTGAAQQYPTLVWPDQVWIQRLGR